MNIGTGTIVGLALLALAAMAVLALWFRFRPRDFLLMAAVCFPVVWFSRLDHVPLMVVGQHVPLHWLVLVGVTVLAWPFADRRTAAAAGPMFRRVLGPLAVLVVVMFISILANARGTQDILLGMRALMFVILPIVAAWRVIQSIPLDEEALKRVVLMLFMIAALTAGLSVVSALTPKIFITLLATSETAEQESARGFTTLGGANTTGTALACVACVASGCVLAGYRRTLSLAMLVLCFLGIVTTLARAAMLAFVLSQAYVFLRLTKGFARRLALFAAIGLFLLVPATYRLARDYSYSLERFLVLHEDSAVARRVALEAAFRYGLDHPVVGGGWGLLYPYGRAVMATRDLPSVWYVGNIATPVVKPHTLYGVVFAETGLIGLLLLLLYFWRIWNALSPPDPRLDQRGNGLVAGFRASFICIAIIAFFQDDLFLLSKLAYVLYLASLTGIVAKAYCQVRIRARSPAWAAGATGTSAVMPVTANLPPSLTIR